MKFSSHTALDSIMNALFVPYSERVPAVRKITEAMISNGIIRHQEDITNDHIAFRTLALPYLGIASFEKIFLHYGYQKRSHYYFEQKKLDAYWYAPPSDAYPRIFISELRIGDLSDQAQSIIAKYTAHITSDPVDALDLDDAETVGRFFYQPLWELPVLEDYHTLLAESEYAAWVIYNRYYLNHYTISVHALKPGYNTLEEFNDFLESIGIRLNNSGGKIKVSGDGLLKQSSSVADMIPATFAHGKTATIAGSYVEFAERLPLPAFRDIPASELTRGQRRDGFDSDNADKIFESTFTGQTGRS